MWNELLQNVYKHYPIGAYRYRETYPGYKEMKEMVERKINADANDPKASCNLFYLDLKTTYPDVEVMNFNHYMFPNYVSIFELGADKTDEKKNLSWLYVCVSLLCDYYTMFVVNTYTIYDYSKKFLSFAIFDVVSFQRKFSPYPYPNIDSIKAIVEGFFPGKAFVSHKHLQSQTVIGGIPFGLEQNERFLQKNYTFLDYLFLNNFADNDHIFFDH